MFVLLRSIVMSLLGFLGASAAVAAMKSSDYFEAGLQRSLAEAGQRGDAREIDRLLATGAAINFVGQERMTALMWTLLHLNKKGFEYLLQKGADPNVTMTPSKLTKEGLTDGSSATSLCARLEDPWYLRTVLKYGGDPNIVNPVRRDTPIFECITLSDRHRPTQAQARIDQIKMLIAAGANLEARNRYGNTPMIAAAWLIRYDIVYELLQAGADPKASTPPRGTTLLDEIPESRIDPKSELYQWRTKVIDLLRSRGIEVPNKALL
jgi:hypothetical protein